MGVEIFRSYYFLPSFEMFRSYYFLNSFEMFCSYYFLNSFEMFRSYYFLNSLKVFCSYCRKIKNQQPSNYVISGLPLDQQGSTVYKLLLTANMRPSAAWTKTFKTGVEIFHLQCEHFSVFHSYPTIGTNKISTPHQKNLFVLQLSKGHFFICILMYLYIHPILIHINIYRYKHCQNFSLMRAQH